MPPSSVGSSQSASAQSQTQIPLQTSSATSANSQKQDATSTSSTRLPAPQSSPGPKSTTPPALSSSVRTLLPLLQSQRQIYVTAHIHARPYLVTQGDTVRLPFLMPGVQPGDILRLNRATTIGSRDFTLRAPGTERRGKSGTAGTQMVVDPTPASTASSTSRVMASNASASLGNAEEQSATPTEHFVPHLAKGRTKYLDDRLFVCRAVVMGTESEPMRIMEKTKRRQRHTRHVKSKHKYTVLRIKEVRVRGVEEVESGELD
ncbi:putative ribosomal prokaryotic L21 protein [Elsinoe australis]|uniref:Large ribosomal subunit protein bL21m n=1 Tax=Elsinoe australis TaxID=40998 RepID=A0A4U7B720_9PEZI|nr:putative ribosomal prokaryotic L21 protein [Elsinoe australis]